MIYPFPKTIVSPFATFQLPKPPFALTTVGFHLKIKEEFGSFSNYIWAFTDNKPIVNNPSTLKEVPSTSAVSDKISKDLKKRGFKFVGSTVVYAHMQATGMVDDHVADCWKRTN